MVLEEVEVSHITKTFLFSNSFVLELNLLCVELFSQFNGLESNLNSYHHLTP